MKIQIIGGGPAGLYFALLARKHNPASQVIVYERNAPDDTFGFGVVFSDQTLSNLMTADPESFAAIREEFVHWDDIDIHYEGQVITSSGHGFAGLSRHRLLEILQRRCLELGVQIEFSREISPEEEQALDGDLVICSDGVNSPLRERYRQQLAPRVDMRPNRFVWLGTTRFFPAFTFYFKRHEAGLFRVHAYSYTRERSTFIVECTEQTWRQAGLDGLSEEQTARWCEGLFAEELQGHPLLINRSIWRQFPAITCERWSVGNRVWMGDAVHTAHFSIGSGTKLAMEDAIALRDALITTGFDLSRALPSYEKDRRSGVASVQRAAQVSMEWFEHTERYFGRLPPLQFAFSLLTRSLRISHENLRVRDAAFVERVDRSFMSQVEEQLGAPLPTGAVIPPMFTPYRLRELRLPNRIAVSPMSMYSAEDGTVDDFHLVHLGSRAIGGAGLVIAEMTDVSRDGRITPGCAGIYRPEHVDAWRRITTFVHRHSEAKIALQLGHAGRKGATKRMWEGMDEPLESGGWPLLSASALPWLPHSQTPREMDREDMDRVLREFVQATHMAVEAGFDMIELHMAHGYLLSSFLSPLTNRRTDPYGGSREGRMRYPLEVYQAVREVWPAHLPISVRISATDWTPGGVDGAEAVEIARILFASGVDLIDVSTGQVVPWGKPQYGRLYQTPYADWIRMEVGMPTMTVGNISSWEDANSVIVAGRADLCAVGRAHLFDPYWTRHAAAAQGYDLPWPDAYSSVARYRPR